jgi:hypothetical protein
MQNSTYRCERRKLSTECPTTLSGRSDTGRTPRKPVANYESHAEWDALWDRLTKECGERCTVLSLVFDLGIWDLRKRASWMPVLKNSSSQSRHSSPRKCLRLLAYSAMRALSVTHSANYQLLEVTGSDVTKIYEIKKVCMGWDLMLISRQSSSSQTRNIKNRITSSEIKLLEITGNYSCSFKNIVIVSFSSFLCFCIW